MANNNEAYGVNLDFLNVDVTLPYDVEILHLRAGATLTILPSDLDSKYANVRTEDGRILLINKDELLKMQLEMHKSDSMGQIQPEPANDAETIIVSNEDELPDYVRAKGVKAGRRLAVSCEGDGLRKVVTPEGVVLWATKEALDAAGKTA
jgi:hypothetical protein